MCLLLVKFGNRQSVHFIVQTRVQHDLKLKLSDIVCLLIIIMFHMKEMNTSVIHGALESRLIEKTYYGIYPILLILVCTLSFFSFNIWISSSNFFIFIL